MSIFEEMHPGRHIESWRGFVDLQRALTEALQQGYIEQVPVMKKHPMLRVVSWFRDKESGEIYSLVPPDFPARGTWEKVDIDDLKQSDLPI